MCVAPDGPLPVYRKNPSPRSWQSSALPRSLWEKKTPRLSIKWSSPAARRTLSRRAGEILSVPNLSVSLS